MTLRWWGLAPLLLCLLSAGAAAQKPPVAVFPLSNLDFGALAPGLPGTVSPITSSGRGSFELSGKGRMTVSLELPAYLTGPGGAQLQLLYGATDGAYQVAGAGGVQRFDPTQPLDLTIPASAGSATVFIGGTARPSGSQRPGAYRGTVTVNLYVPGT